MTLEERKKFVRKYQDLWKEHLAKYPEDEWMQDYAVSYDPHPERYCVVLIPVCSIENRDWYLVDATFDDIKNFGTSCGRVGPQHCYNVFGTTGVAEFLQAFCVEFIVGCVSIPTGDKEPGIPLDMIAFKGPEILAAGFANFINNLGGSLRWDDSSDGQCLFESE